MFRLWPTHRRTDQGIDLFGTFVELDPHVQQTAERGITVHTAVKAFVRAARAWLPYPILHAPRHLDNGTLGGELGEIVDVPADREVHVTGSRLVLHQACGDGVLRGVHPQHHGAVSRLAATTRHLRRPDRRTFAIAGRFALNGPDPPADTRLAEAIHRLGVVTAGVEAGRHDREGIAVNAIPDSLEIGIQQCLYIGLIELAVDDVVVNRPGLFVDAPANDFHFQTVVLSVDADGDQCHAIGHLGRPDLATGGQRFNLNFPPGVFPVRQTQLGVIERQLHVLVIATGQPLSRDI